MRILVTDRNTDARTLRDRLLSGKLSVAQADAALASLQMVNPHVDLTDLRPGTVVFVPDTPDFKQAGSDAVFGDALQEFEQMVKTALDTAASRSKAAGDLRTAEGAEVSKVLKSAALKRVLGKDAELLRAVEVAIEAVKRDKDERGLAEETLTNASQAALETLRSLRESLQAG
jgi:hypothetical protein